MACSLGDTRRRVDVLMTNAEEFAHNLYYSNIFAPLVWKDPVQDVHMRLSSDVVIFIPGTLLSQEKEFVPWRSQDTGDYVAPRTIPPKCIITARRRENGEIEF